MSLRGSLLLALAYVLLLALIAFAVPLAVSLRDRQDEEVRLQARGQADVVAATAAPLLAPARHGQLNALAATTSDSVRGRVLIVDASGTVLADSAGLGQTGADYSARPEITSALRGRRYQQNRHSATLHEDLLATAAPVLRRGQVTGAVRITQSVAAVHRAVRRSIAGLALIAAVVLSLGMAAGWLIARRLALPLRRLEATAGEIAHGALDRRAPVEGTREQRSLARSFNAMTDRLSRALRAQQEFVADASHQLRTPLTGLRLRLEEVQVSANGSEPIGGDLDAALNEVGRLSHTVDELLLLSSAGGRDAPPEEVDLAASARAAAKRWQATAAERRIALTCANGANGRVKAARVDLDRALDSLVENALKYSPPGSEVQLETGAGRVQVLDSGPGLAPGEEEEVFDRFHRGRAGRMEPAGTGLGLPIARELMRRWDARVLVENRPEGGARAVIVFSDARSDGGR
jgi:two-component system, OmpR family, sensor kinase